MIDYDDALQNFDDMLDDDFGDSSEPEPTLADALAAMQRGEVARTSHMILYGLSDVPSAEVMALEAAWAGLETGYRRRLMRDLIAFAEANIEMDYRTVGLHGMADPDAGVREAAIELLWEDQSLEVMNHLVELAAHDIASEVRAAAATALGRYILAGELGDLPEQDTQAAQEIVVRLLQDPNEPVAVQRRALEAISNCSHPIVPGAIESAYHGSGQEMRVSAIYAMGRSYDNRWDEIVLEEIESSDPEIRYEAARAAGELEIEAAVSRLGRLMIDDNREILEVAVWSLGEIGGKEAVRILSALAEKAEAEDDVELMDAIDDAIGNASLADGLIGDFDLGDLD